MPSHFFLWYKLRRALLLGNLVDDKQLLFSLSVQVMQNMLFGLVGNDVVLGISLVDARVLEAGRELLKGSALNLLID